jgi:hypothetical protein
LQARKNIRTDTGHRTYAWVRWLLVLAWALFIWSRSLFAGPESNMQSDAVVHVVRPVFEFNGISDVTIMSFVVRKSGHFLEYAVLGGLLATTAERGEDPALVRAHWLPAAFVALADEALQLFVPGRTGKLSDSLLDCVGALVGFCLVFLVLSAVFRRLGRRA